MVQMTPVRNKFNPGPTPQWFKSAINSVVNKLLRSGKKPQGIRAPKGKLYKRIMSGKSHLFKQKVVDIITSTTNSGGFSIFSQTFSLAQLPNASEYTSLFDSYRIRKIKVTFQSTQASSKENEVATASDLLFGAVIDVDDDSTSGWVDFTEISQYNDWRPKKITGNIVKKYFTPTVNNQIQADADATAIKTMYSPLLDCADTSVTHLGLKCALLALPSQVYRIYRTTTYYLEFQNKR